MYIIVIGGGKVGYYLTKTLINEGHEVLVIEKDRRKCGTISEELGSIVVQGDGAEFSTLSDAGAARADVVVAVTGDDEDNLVICQVAKRKFNVGRTIARINNPKNERIFKLLGIDATVSSTNLILWQIEQEIPRHALIRHLMLKGGELEVVEVVVDPKSRVAGRPLRDVTLPPDSVIPLIVRGGSAIIPMGNTVLQAGDEILALTKQANEAALREAIIG